MVTHIVMIKFKNETPKDKILEIKRDLEALIDSIDELKFMEVGLNFANSDRAMDLVLTAKFDDKDGLKVYANAPSHLKVKDKIKEYGEYTKVVDYINE